MLALLLAGIFLAVLSAQEMPKGEWRAEFQTGGEQIWLQIRWVTSDGLITWGHAAKRRRSLGTGSESFDLARMPTCILNCGATRAR